MGRVKLICLFCKKHEREKGKDICYICKHGNVWTEHRVIDRSVKMYPNGIFPEVKRPTQKVGNEVISGFSDIMPRK